MQPSLNTWRSTYPLRCRAQSLFLFDLPRLKVSLIVWCIMSICSIFWLVFKCSIQVLMPRFMIPLDALLQLTSNFGATASFAIQIFKAHAITMGLRVAVQVFLVQSLCSAGFTMAPRSNWWSAVYCRGPVSTGHSGFVWEETPDDDKVRQSIPFLYYNLNVVNILSD